MQYQNCAPTPQSLNESVESSLPENRVDGIDSVQMGDISFQQSKVSAFAADELTVYGVCQDSGARIGWSLVDLDDQVVERGLAECELGAFEVSLAGKWKSYCDENLVLKAALGVKSKSQTIIETLCN